MRVRIVIEYDNDQDTLDLEDEYKQWLDGDVTPADVIGSGMGTVTLEAIDG